MNSKNFLSSFLFSSSLFSVFSISCDSPEAWQMSFQDPATPLMEGIINLHHDLMFIVIFIAVAVLWMILRTVSLFNHTVNSVPSSFIKHPLLETVWTLIPTGIVAGILGPSLALIYAMDEVVDPSLTVKAIGHQWYWCYEYDDFVSSSRKKGINIESYMVDVTDLKPGELRLLQVDNAVVLPIQLHIRLLVTSMDVLHCWSVNSLGVKVDAVPGRLSQAAIYIKRPGMFTGQCSEICGQSHGMMPIVVHSILPGEFITWVNLKLKED